MADEHLARTVVAISEIFDYSYNGTAEQRWFVSFGSLLWFIRDRLLGRPLEQDIDISVEFNSIPRDQLIEHFGEYGYGLSGEVLTDTNGLPLQMSFSPQSPGFSPVDIDVFFWVLGKRYAWHTYDVSMIHKPVLPEYVFKATPIEYFTAPTIKQVWEEIAPAVSIPSMYGSLLDTWYPPIKRQDGGYVENSGWMTRNPHYGQSKAVITRALTTCAGLMSALE